MTSRTSSVDFYFADSHHQQLTQALLGTSPPISPRGNPNGHQNDPSQVHSKRSSIKSEAGSYTDVSSVDQVKEAAAAAKRRSLIKDHGKYYSNTATTNPLTISTTDSTTDSSNITVAPSPSHQRTGSRGVHRRLSSAELTEAMIVGTAAASQLLSPDEDEEGDEEGDMMPMANSPKSTPTMIIPPSRRPSVKTDGALPLGIVPPVPTPQHHVSANGIAKSFITPTSYSSHAQAFFHQLLQAKSSDIQATSKHRHAMLIHQPLTTITPETQILRLDGVELSAMETPTPKLTISQQLAANAGTFDRLSRLLSKASLNNNGESAMDDTGKHLSQVQSATKMQSPRSTRLLTDSAATSSSSEILTSDISKAFATLQLTTPAVANAIGATITTAPLPVEITKAVQHSASIRQLTASTSSSSMHATKPHASSHSPSSSLSFDPSDENSVLLTLRQLHQPPAVGTSTSGLRPRKTAITTPVGQTLEGVAMAAARKLIHSTLAASHSAAALQKEPADEAKSNHHPRQPSHSSSVRSLQSSSSKRTLQSGRRPAPPLSHSASSAKQTPSKPSPFIPPLPINIISNEEHKSDEEIIPTPLQSCLKTSIDARTIPPQQLQLVSNFGMNSNVTFSSALPPPPPSPPPPAVVAAAVNESTSPSLVVPFVPPPLIKRKLSFQAPQKDTSESVTLPSSTTAQHDVAPDIPASIVAASALDHFHPVFYPPPIPSPKSALSPAGLQHAYARMASKRNLFANPNSPKKSSKKSLNLDDIPPAEVIGGVSFRRHPSEQAMFLKKLEASVQRQTTSTFETLVKDGCDLTAVGLQLKNLKSNEQDWFGYNTTKKVTDIQDLLAKTHRTAYEEADQTWQREREELDREYRRRNGLLTTRLSQLAERMVTHSNTNWSASEAKREELERQDLEEYCQADRMAELQALEQKLRQRQADERARWDAEWAAAKRAKEEARAKAELDAAIKMVEVEKFKAQEYEKKRLKARNGVLWVRIKWAQDLGEENGNVNTMESGDQPLETPHTSKSIGSPASVKVTNTPHPPSSVKHHHLSPAISSPHPSHSGGSGGGAESPDSNGGLPNWPSSAAKASPTILPRQTTTCIAVQLRFKAASLANEVVYTRYFGRTTSPVIDECFRLNVSNAYLQTVRFVVQTSPIKQIEIWEREVRAAVSLQATEDHRTRPTSGHMSPLMESRASSRSSSVMGEAIKTGQVQVKHAVMKDPHLLTGPSPATKHHHHTSISGAMNELVESSRHLQPQPPPSLDPIVDASITSSTATSSTHHSPNASSSPSPIPSPTSSSSLMPSPRHPKHHTPRHHRSNTATQAPHNPSQASSGIGAGGWFLPLPMLEPILGRLRPRDEVVSRVEEFGHVELPISSIRSSAHGRLCKSLQFTRILTDQQKKERELRRHESKKIAALKAAAYQASSTAMMAMVATQHPQIALLSPNSFGTSAGQENIIRTTPASSPASSPIIETLSPGAKKSRHKTISTLRGDRIEIVDCGRLQVELILLPLFSLAAHQQEPSFYQAGSLRIGETTLTESEQTALALTMEHEAELATQQQLMPDLSYLDDPTHVPKPTPAELKLEELRARMIAKERANNFTLPAILVPTPSTTRANNPFHAT